MVRTRQDDTLPDESASHPRLLKLTEVPLLLFDFCLGGLRSFDQLCTCKDIKYERDCFENEYLVEPTVWRMSIMSTEYLVAHRLAHRVPNAKRQTPKQDKYWGFIPGGGSPGARSPGREGSPT